MTTAMGSGEFRYEVIEGWGRLPGGWTFREVAAVAVDKKDQVYCFTRGEHPIIVFDREGNFLRSSWGETIRAETFMSPRYRGRSWGNI
jgi:hypothetical protein